MSAFGSGIGYVTLVQKASNERAGQRHNRHHQWPASIPPAIHPASVRPSPQGRTGYHQYTMPKGVLICQDCWGREPTLADLYHDACPGEQTETYRVPERETFIEMHVVTQCLSECDSFSSDKLTHWVWAFASCFACCFASTQKGEKSVFSKRKNKGSCDCSCHNQEKGTLTVTILTRLTLHLVMIINPANPAILSCVDTFISLIPTRSMQHMQVHRGGLSRVGNISQFDVIPNSLAVYCLPWGRPLRPRGLRPRPLAWRGFRGLLPIVGPGAGDVPRGGLLLSSTHLSSAVHLRGPSSASSRHPSTVPAGATNCSIHTAATYHTLN
jgi:hypothetical protein